VEELLDAVVDTLAGELLPEGDLRVRAHVGWRDMVNGKAIVPAAADCRAGLELEA